VSGPALDEVPVFFYGLFMDADNLCARGARPRDGGTSYVQDYELVLGARMSTLRETAGARVWGRVYSLTRTELEDLYAGERYADYKARTVTAHSKGAEPRMVRTYIRPLRTDDDQIDKAYAAALAAAALKVGLPEEYVQSLRAGK
jgi:hypothetical protein